MELISQRIEFACDKTRRSNAAIAADMGIKSENTIGNWRKGRTEPTVSEAQKIAEICGVDFIWLISGVSSVAQLSSPSITTNLENPSPSPQLLPSGSKPTPAPSQPSTELLKQQIELLKKDNEHLKAQSVSQNTVLLALQEQIKDLRELTVAQKDHSDTQKEVIRLLKEQQAAHRSTPTKQYAPVAQSHS